MSLNSRSWCQNLSENYPKNTAEKYSLHLKVVFACDIKWFTRSMVVCCLENPHYCSGIIKEASIGRFISLEIVSQSALQIKWFYDVFIFVYLLLSAKSCFYPLDFRLSSSASSVFATYFLHFPVVVHTHVPSIFFFALELVLLMWFVIFATSSSHSPYSLLIIYFSRYFLFPYFLNLFSSVSKVSFLISLVILLFCTSLLSVFLINSLNSP